MALVAIIPLLFSVNLNKRMIFKKWWQSFFFFRKKDYLRKGKKYHYNVNDLTNLLGYTPQDFEWFDKALTHPFQNKRDNQGNEYNYDRLEFLGDAVISLVISEYLFMNLPAYPEGKLSELRAQIVSRKNLNRIGRKLNIRKFFRGHPRQQLGENLEGNVLEALTGAIYVDKGFEAAKKFVHRHIIDPYVNLEQMINKISSYKNALIKWAQKHKKHVHFDIKKNIAPEGEKYFTAKVFIDGKFYGFGNSHTKKKAEEIASKYAYAKLTRITHL